MKRVQDLVEALGLEVACGSGDMQREIDGGIYCCDLLSIVMGRAPAGGVWVTVMANINAVAVAVLCDLACIVIAEGMQIDAQTIEKAREQDVVLLKTGKPVFETAMAIDGCLRHEA